MRLLLHGGSVVDWHKLDFADHAAVDRFLRINEYDPDSAEEMARLEEIRLEAVDYLTRVFTMAVPHEVGYEVPARDLFLMASRNGRHRRWACVVLKLMHIINHLAGREAITRLPIADDAIFRATELKVIQMVDELRAAGYPIMEFEWSRKQRDSLITKLLAKRSTLAAKVYDKLRFRLTVPEHEDLVPVLIMLMRRLIPFNYIVPGESINHLLHFEELLRTWPTVAAEVPVSGEQDMQDQARTKIPGLNEFSGPEYRIINFVVDLPLRLDGLVPEQQVPAECGHLVFVLVEFQIADKQTAMRNQLGESSHDRYKARQHRKVRTRLMCGESEEDGCGKQHEITSS
jgi:uncharacterized protein (TIGR04552 family)